MRLLIVVITILLFISSPSFAKDPLSYNPDSPWYGIDEPTGWNFDLGIGAELEPSYAGSSNTATEAALFARATYRTHAGHRFFMSLGEFGAIYSISPNTQFVAFLEYEEGRDADDDDNLIGLEPIDSTIEGQFTLAQRFGNTAIFATLQPDLTGGANKGLVWFLGASYDRFLNQDKWRVGARFDISGADSEYMQTEFGITADEAARTKFAVFTPNSGLKSATLNLSAEYFWRPNLSFLSSIDIENYLGDTKDSPLVRDVGDATTIEASALIKWHF